LANTSLGIPCLGFLASPGQPQRLRTVKPPGHRRSVLLHSLPGPYFPGIFRLFNTPKRWSLDPLHCTIRRTARD
jgi:hypothetical protein